MTNYENNHKQIKEAEYLIDEIIEAIKESPNIQQNPTTFSYEISF